MRLFLRTIAFIFLLIFIPSGTSFASSDYLNKELDTSLSLSDGWNVFSDNFHDTISPEEKEFLKDSFVYVKQRGVTLDLRFYEKGTSRSDKINDILIYAKNTSDDKKDYTRLTNFIPIEFGSQLKDIEVYEERSRIITRLTGSNKSGKYTKFVGWYDSNKGLIELELSIKNNESIGFWSVKFEDIVDSIVQPSTLEKSSIKEFDGNFTDDGVTLEFDGEEVGGDKNEIKEFVLNLLRSSLDKVIDADAWKIVTLVLSFSFLTLVVLVHNEYKK